MMTTADVQKNNLINISFANRLFEKPEGKEIKRCIQCGTCSGICPVGDWMDLTPRKAIFAIRSVKFNESPPTDTVWMCVSCYACSGSCPQQIPLTQGLMVYLKEQLLLEGDVPIELQTALENSQRYGNPMGESPRLRGDWAKKLEVPILNQAKRPVDVLWYVGDYASYHPSVQNTATALVHVLRALEVDFGILGPEEVSDGDSQRMAGEYGLFEMLAEKNARVFDKYSFKEVITTDPHAYNAIKNEYPKLGFSYPIRHYTQFLAERLDMLKPLLKNEIKAIVSFHDPCYLGRVNNIYEEPRMLLEAIPGVQLMEMSHNKANSLCCGGGGGGMWLDGFQWDISGERTSEWRVSEMVAAKPLEAFISVMGEKPKRKAKKGKVELKKRILAVACPYEKPRFEDASKVVQKTEDLVVMDISEMLMLSMGIS